MPTPPNSTWHLLRLQLGKEVLGGTLPENVSDPCCPSDPFSVQIYLSSFLEYWVPLFYHSAWPFPSPSSEAGGWFPSVADTESFIQGLSCPYLSPPFRARAQSVFVQMNWSLLLLKYAHCWVSSRGQRIFSTGQEFHRQRRKGHSVPQTFPEADSGVGGWAHSHLPHGLGAPPVRERSS